MTRSQTPYWDRSDMMTPADSLLYYRNLSPSRQNHKVLMSH